MAILAGKKILLAVSGSIAAYKAPFIVRQFVKKGAEVRVIMTHAAKDFVSPLTLSTLTNYPVHLDFFSPDEPEQGWVNHVDLGRWADLMIVAPVSSNTLSKMASGASDNLLLATYMSAKCPVYFAPAMDLDMYKNQATQDNIKNLEKAGLHFIPSEFGELASGLEGEGRMAEPEHIREFVEERLRLQQPLSGRKVLINAGPTYEAIDPVRFIGNHASGKTGIFLAEAAVRLGAEVTLVLGPSSVQFDERDMTVIRVTSTQEMYEACEIVFQTANYAIFSAAVADYKPQKTFDQKIKKKDGHMQIDLSPTVDILKTLGNKKKKEQIVIGFALETENLLENAKRKMHTKNADFIVCNTTGEQTGFKHNTNQVIVLGANDLKHELPLMQKREMAEKLWEIFLK